MDGEADRINGPFSVAISGVQQEKGKFKVGDSISGTGWTKMYDYSEYADYYRTGQLKVFDHSDLTAACSPPPWIIVPPSLEIYAYRRCRKLALSHWKAKCFQCVWANMAAVTIEYNFGKTQKHRFESFCYGPKSCKFYAMGKPRAVPYKGEDSDYDEEWMDDDFTSHRDWDE
jgi:hypothetical protein